MKTPSTTAMYRTLLGVTLAGTLSGCSYFGYHKQEKARWAPPEQRRELDFPDSFATGLHLTGPMAVAMDAALRDFLPPGGRPSGRGTDPRVEECLSRRSTYETFILQANEDLYFVRFSPVLDRCGLDVPILDGGAVYAVDGQGQILEAR
ncbi:MULTISPECIES: hypothetical protein [Myxococcus]|uniref:hypothetical protein n=1 Tax=Myxococcus TaxID=32 RepID=UPI00114128DC|nr:MULTISPECIES: hypothetical protein [Myxococcus]MCK8501541.1 hypothetical protein [Myxococcus fulvus]